MPENELARAVGGLDTSSYPKWGAGTKLEPPPNPLKGASDALGVLQQLQNLDQTKFDLLNKQHGALANAFSAILADPSQDNITRRAIELRQMGVPQQAIMSGLQEFGQARTPDDVKRIALRHLGQLASIQERLQLGGMAAPQLHSDGKSALPISFGSGLNQGIRAAPGGAIPNRLSPRELTETVEVTLPDGSKRRVPVGQIFGETGRVPGAPVPGQPAPAAPPPIGRGRVPSAGASAAAPGQEPGAPGLGVNGLPSANAPADTADQAASTQAFVDARNDIQPSRDRATTMQLALDAVRGTNVGLGTAGRQKMLNFINSLPNGWGKMLVPDGAELSDFEVGRKYLAATQAGAQGAGRSDAALAIAAASNPNTDMTKGALTETAITNIGRERMKQAQVIDHLNSGKSPAEFSNRLAREWDRVGDPKAYALPAMTPGERAEHFAKLKGPERARFLASVRKGLETGVLTREDLIGAVPNAGAK